MTLSGHMSTSAKMSSRSTLPRKAKEKKKDWTVDVREVPGKCKLKCTQ